MPEAITVRIANPDPEPLLRPPVLGGWGSAVPVTDGLGVCVRNGVFVGFVVAVRVGGSVVAVRVDVFVGVVVAVCVGVEVWVSVPVGVLVGVFDGVLVTVFVGVSDGVLVTVFVGVSEGVLVTVLVAVLVGVSVGVLVAVFVEVSVGVLVAVLVEVSVGVLVEVLVAVLVGVSVAVAVAVGVGVGVGSQQKMMWLTSCPVTELRLVSPVTPGAPYEKTLFVVADFTMTTCTGGDAAEKSNDPPPEFEIVTVKVAKFLTPFVGGSTFAAPVRPNNAHAASS